VTASVRLAAPSLPRRWLTCFLTVPGVTTSSPAMRWFPRARGQQPQHLQLAGGQRPGQARHLRRRAAPTAGGHASPLWPTPRCAPRPPCRNEHARDAVGGRGTLVAFAGGGPRVAPRRAAIAGSSPPVSSKPPLPWEPACATAPTPL
jgi:hypothetical protein